jgi:hypothetical protein
VTTPANINVLNRNAFYGEGTVYLAYWGGTQCRLLGDLRTASGKEANSVVANPLFTSATDLHVNSPWLDGAGQAVPAGATDIDGNARSGSTPDIGADEFTSSLTKLAGGTYTVGGTSPDYGTLALASGDVMARGVTGPVVFSIRPGTYTEQVDMRMFGGASSTSTVTFQPESGGVTWDGTPSGSVNYVLRLNAVGHVRVRDLTLQASGFDMSNRTALAILGSVDDVQVTGSTISGIPSAGGSQALAVVSGTNALSSNLVLSGNTVNQGSYGMYLDGYSGQYATGTVIQGNTINNGSGYGGMYVSYQRSAAVDSNTVSGNSRGVYLDQMQGRLLVRKNRVDVAGSSAYAVFLSSFTGTPPDTGLVANNFVSVRGSGSGIGLYLNSVSGMNVYHNSILVSSGSASSYALYQSGGTASTLNVVNNIFANTAGGYAYYVTTPANINVSNYNNYFTTGANLAAWGGSTTIVNLAALRTANSKDAFSGSGAVQFVSSTDLHLQGSSIGDRLLAGTPLAVVPRDIDDDLRGTQNPYMGADEGNIVLAVGDRKDPGGAGAGEVPAEFVLYQNFPNPFNPSTTIRYGLPHRSTLQIMLYNALGQEVAVLDRGEKESGYHEFRFDATALPSGVYFYRLKARAIDQADASEFVQIRKLVLLK